MNDKQPNKQKWLTDKLSGEWMDKDMIIETVLVECLRHFVEEEKGLVDPSELHPDDRNHHERDVDRGK